MKVLIVEDDPPSREFLGEIVEGQGHKVCLAENGLEGLEQFKEFNPDLVFSDIQMPKLNGLELLQEIRKLDSGVIVVMNTAFGCEKYAVDALQLKANNYLKKPLRRSDLVPLLQKCARIVDKSAKPKSLPQKEPAAFFTLSLGNDLDQISEAVESLILKTGNALGEEERLDVKLGLTELLTNSVEHGNLELSSSDLAKALEHGEEGKKNLYKYRQADPALAERKVKVGFKSNAHSCEWKILDQGSGFDWEKLLHEVDHGNLLNLEGKGIFLCRFHFDDLVFSGKGNLVTATKNR